MTLSITSLRKSSHAVLRPDESDADVLEAEFESGQEAGAGVDEGGALVAGQLEGDEESEAAEEGELRDQQPKPLHSSPAQKEGYFSVVFVIIVVVSGSHSIVTLHLNVI